MTNPLLDFTGLPPFSKIEPQHIEPAIDSILAENRRQIESLVSQTKTYTWDNFILPFEHLDDRLSRAWAAVNHMNSVVNTEELRAAYNACLPKLSEYSTELGQHDGIYQAIKAIAESPAFNTYDKAQQKVIKNMLRDFRLSGIDLDAEKKLRYKEIQQELAKLTTKFEENVLDATFGWNKPIEDESRLSGLPESARAMARQTAERDGKKGWVFTLEFPSYYSVMSYADDRELRREMYAAYVTRASEQGPNPNKWDNTEVMKKILVLRHELSQLLGFDNYAHYSLETKMAAGPIQVMEFLDDLAQRTKKIAQQELEELTKFAREQSGVDTLETWDIAYYSEKLRQHKYDISQEDLKPYFPADRVVPGMFEVVKRLYGLDIKEVTGVDTWHKDTRFYEIYGPDGNLRGQFYLDLYARPNKRGGAWMAECLSRKRAKDQLQYPVAFLTCNLTPPIGDDPAQFTHDEVVTLFHEFGHGLHHMLTKVDYPSVSGISGVPWDAVELPSQFMENWCWEREALDLIARHHKTDDPLPDELFKKMHAAKNFQSGMQMVRQLEFALFDFRMHLEFDPTKGPRIQETLDEVRQQVAVIKPPAYNRFQHGFSHIFAGGYAAGYYSYKWAEVLSADAFSKFEERGIFDQATGTEFLRTVLEQGGAADPMDLFIEFRGREPEIDALLRHSGIAA
jgi:oligopeptidase A